MFYLGILSGNAIGLRGFFNEKAVSFFCSFLRFVFLFFLVLEIMRCVGPGLRERFCLIMRLPETLGYPYK